MKSAKKKKKKNGGSENATVNKYMKKCPTSPAVREAQIKQQILGYLKNQTGRNQKSLNLESI
jgi:hypothetical protein